MHYDPNQHNQYQPPPAGPPGPPPKPIKRGVPKWALFLTAGLVAFGSCTAGVGIGASGDTTEVASASGQIDERRQALDDRKADLDERETELVERAEQLKDRKAALDKRAARLDEKEQKKAKQEAANTIPGDGVFMVGEDVKPGTYRTGGSAYGGDMPCYFARLKDTSGDFNAIITNGNPVGPTTVTIKSSDDAFETSGCQEWSRR